MNGSPQFESLFVTAHDVQLAEARDYYVVQHNDLVQNQRFQLSKNAGTSLSLTEEKILAYLISQIKPDAERLEVMEFDIKSFCEVVGIDCKNMLWYYTRLKELISKLAGRVMWLYDSRTGSETTVRYIDRAHMNKGSGTIKIRLDEMLGPYLLNLSGNYFQFSYHNILAMKTKYGIQLYKLLKSYSFNNSRLKFSLDDLKGQLDTLNYENFTNFRNKVIDPALRDINQYTDLAVSVEYIKTGRTYTDVIFTIRSLEKATNPEDAAEAQRRYLNAERIIDPNQVILDCY